MAFPRSAMGDGSTSRWEPISDILEILDGSSDSFDLIVCWRKNYDIFGLHCLHHRRADFISLLHPLIIATEEKKSSKLCNCYIFCRVNFLFFLHHRPHHRHRPSAQIQFISSFSRSHNIFPKKSLRNFNFWWHFYSDSPTAFWVFVCSTKHR